jgi:hypothetical protein
LNPDRVFQQSIQQHPHDMAPQEPAQKLAPTVKQPAIAVAAGVAVTENPSRWRSSAALFITDIILGSESPLGCMNLVLSVVDDTSFFRLNRISGYFQSWTISARSPVT